MDSDKNFSEQQLHDLLQKVKVPDKLEYQLKANLSYQIDSEKHQRSRWIPAFTAALMLSVGLGLWWSQISHVPTFVSAAEAHVEHEITVAGHLTREGFSTWQQASAFPMSQLDIQLELVKDCWVDGYTLKHLRLRYPDGKSIDVLVSSVPLPLETQNTGYGKQFFWRGAVLPTGAHLIALYLDKSGDSRVEQLLRAWATTT